MIHNPIIHVAYAEDHPVVRKGVISVLHDMGGIKVDIDAGDGEELIRKISIARQVPAVCVLDIHMPGMNGFDTIMELKKNWPEMGVLVYTVFELEMYIIKMVRYGAQGYVSKNCGPTELVRAINTVSRNEFYYSDTITYNFINEIRRNPRIIPFLKTQEEELLKLICTDLTYAQISGEMGLSVRSVEGMRDALFNKLKIRSRTGLAMFAIQFGIVPMETYS